MGELQLTYRDSQVTPVQTASTVFPHDDMLGDSTALEALQATLAGAVDAIVLGRRVKTVRVAERDTGVNQPAANANARRELKWRVDYHDAVSGQPGHLTIPCPNLALADSNIVELDMTGSPGDPGYDFRAAFEAVVKGADGGAAIIDRVVIVGRNL